MRFGKLSSAPLRVAAIVAFAACPFLLGCGDPPLPPTHSVSGTVTVDGKPIPDGKVIFVTVAEGVQEALPVKDGKFSGTVQAGQRTIRIYAYREEKQGVEMYGADAPVEKVNYVDPKFNNESTMTETVTEGGPNEFSWEVTSVR